MIDHTKSVVQNYLHFSLMQYPWKLIMQQKRRAELVMPNFGYIHTQSSVKIPPINTY